MLTDYDNNASREPMELADFCAVVQAKLADGASLWDCRGELPGLSRNKDFLLDKIHENLAGLWGRDYQGDYGNAALLSVFEGWYNDHCRFYVRVVFWAQALDLHPDNELFLYDSVPHDHNFNLLTVGFAGPGYETSVWHYDRSTVTGYIGEAVPLTWQGRFQLTPGALFLFEQNRDVHIQHTPAAPSISLNLITATAPQPPQYLFDIERQRIRDIPPRLIQRREPLFALAAALGDDTTLDLLDNLIRKDTLDPLLRQSAMTAATQIFQRDPPNP